MKRSLKELKEISKICKGDILKITTIAGSGHPGGSMSSLDIFLSVFNRANINPNKPYDKERDKIVISHGHTSPGVYSALARLNFFDIDEVISGFRHPASIFEGHVTRGIPGIEWSTGNLGQGLSAGVGFAISSKINNINNRIYVFSSDGESSKGQIAEARRTAIKEKLNNLTVIIDYNDIQITGRARDVLKIDIAKEYKNSGWNVIEIDGHDYEQINIALEVAEKTLLVPTVIISNTRIGKGISFMENLADYHGKPLNKDQLNLALNELDLINDIEDYFDLRKKLNYNEKNEVIINNDSMEINTGDRIVYEKNTSVDNRSAFGNFITNIFKINENNNIVAIDCDLSPSVKLDEFKKIADNNYIQIGIQEHNAATIAGALSTTNILTYFVDFGVFGLDEVFNQQRLNDINKTNLKTILTHCGIDVGEDGKTHHAINYLNLCRSFFNSKLFIPSDANQCDSILRYSAKTEGNHIIVMGRSKIPIILNNNDEIYFDSDYNFSPKTIDVLRKGKEVTIITYGTFAHIAVKAADILKNEGININVLNVPSPLEANYNLINDFLENNVIITLEDHNVYSGISNEISKHIINSNINIKNIVSLGIDCYASSGSSDMLFSIYGLDYESIVFKVKEYIK